MSWMWRILNPSIPSPAGKTNECVCPFVQPMLSPHLPRAVLPLNLGVLCSVCGGSGACTHSSSTRSGTCWCSSYAAKHYRQRCEETALPHVGRYTECALSGRCSLDEETDFYIIKIYVPVGECLGPLGVSSRIP